MPTPTRKKPCMCDVRSENGTYTVTAMLDTGIAVSCIGCVQFITGTRVNALGSIISEHVPVANPVNLRVVLDKILPVYSGKGASKSSSRTHQES